MKTISFDRRRKMVSRACETAKSMTELAHLSGFRGKHALVSLGNWLRAHKDEIQLKRVFVLTEK